MIAVLKSLDMVHLHQGGGPTVSENHSGIAFIQVIQNLGVVVCIGQPECAIVLGQRESIAAFAEIGAVVRGMGARLIVAPVIAVVPGRSLALYNEEFSFIGEPVPAIRVIRLCVLEVKVRSQLRILYHTAA